jgi:hypothetical protein
MVYISPCLDRGVVKWTAETAGRSAIEEANRRGVGGVDGLLAGHSAGVVDAAQVLFDELNRPEKC